MAVAGTLRTPTRHPRAREECEHAHKSAAEHVQQASAEIDKTCQEATADVRRSLDTALERIRDVSGELRQLAEHQSAERQDALEHTSDTARRQMRRPGIRAQRTPEALEGSRTRSASRRQNWGRRRRRAASNTASTARRARPVAVLPESVRPVGRVEARWPRSTLWS